MNTATQKGRFPLWLEMSLYLHSMRIRAPIGQKHLSPPPKARFAFRGTAIDGYLTLQFRKAGRPVATSQRPALILSGMFAGRAG